MSKFNEKIRIVKMLHGIGEKLVVSEHNAYELEAIMRMYGYVLDEYDAATHIGIWSNGRRAIAMKDYEYIVFVLRPENVLYKGRRNED